MQRVTKTRFDNFSGFTEAFLVKLWKYIKVPKSFYSINDFENYAKFNNLQVRIKVRF